LSEEALSKTDPSLITKALIDGIRRAGLATLAWTPELQEWRRRVQFLRRLGERDVSAPRGRQGEMGHRDASASRGWEGKIGEYAVPATKERKIANTTWPDLSDERLFNTLEDWLGPYLHGISSAT
jgi:ATP-dependent helicase HrpB